MNRRFSLSGKGADIFFDPSQAAPPKPETPSPSDDQDSGRDFDGELLPGSHAERRAAFAVEPMPYLELERRATPLAAELIAALALEPTYDREQPSERGGSLSVRQYLREPERPFLLRDDEHLAPPRLALRVVIDHSTSMNYGAGGGRSRIACATEAAMMLHLACLELGYEHAVSLMPEQITLADLAAGERGKALIAGAAPARTGYEDLAVAIQERSAELLAAMADIRLLLVLHDGYPSDAPAATSLCRDLRDKVHIVGILLDPDEATSNAMAEIFGADRLVACSSPQLPRKLALMLEAIRGS